ncbi:MAG: selenide, water dikinase SelD [bacterium]
MNSRQIRLPVNFNSVIKPERLEKIRLQVSQNKKQRNLSAFTAGLYDTGNQMSIMQTLHVYTPMVEDPYIFGQIAAASSLGETYACGGTPLTALNIVGFPAKQVDRDIMVKMLQGGINKLKEAGVVLIGGHSMQDPQVKCGYVINVMVDQKNVKKHAHARRGDVLIITKPVGAMFVLAKLTNRDTAQKSDEALKEVINSMCALNNKASAIINTLDAHICQHVSEPGLKKSLDTIARKAGGRIEIWHDQIPLFGNQQQYRKDILEIISGPEISGGLLFATAPQKAEKTLQILHNKGLNKSSIIGKIN